MGANSAIEWTDHTFNPWWGCVKVSAGCTHCYAETLSARYGQRLWGPPATTSRRTFGQSHWAEPIRWNLAAERERRRRRVFCASMADVFEMHSAVDSARQRLWSLIEETPWLDWLLLTKRPENLVDLLPGAWLRSPRKNVWVGTSVEDESTAAVRIPLLIRTPATVRFLSCEPLLGPLPNLDLNGIDWVIVGGESGANARRMDPEWARLVKTHCDKQEVAYFFKQAGSVLAAEWGMPGKGHDLQQVPHELRERSYPSRHHLTGSGSSPRRSISAQDLAARDDALTRPEGCA